MQTRHVRRLSLINVSIETTGRALDIFPPYNYHKLSEQRYPTKFSNYMSLCTRIVHEKNIVKVYIIQCKIAECVFTRISSFSRCHVIEKNSTARNICVTMRITPGEEQTPRGNVGMHESRKTEHRGSPLSVPRV